MLVTLRYLTYCLLLIGQVVFLHTAIASKQDISQEEATLILSINISNMTLHEGIFSYYIPPGIIYLPFSEIMQTLDIAITLSSDRKFAKGWFFKEENTFFLDTEKSEVIIRGVAQPLSQIETIIRDDELYVSIHAITDWFGIKININLLRSLLSIESNSNLPIEKKLLRKRKWDDLTTTQHQIDKSKFNNITPPYSWLSWPMTDHKVRFIVKKYNDNNYGKIKTYNGFLTGDLLKMTTEISANINSVEGGETDRKIRVKMGRYKPKGMISGITQYSLGDIYSSDIPLISSETEGVGISISNFPKDSGRHFGYTTIRGHIQPGWDIELYHNDILIDFQTDRESNIFEFNNVPLYYGNNIYRIHYYGPQGQLLSESIKKQVGNTMFKPGNHYFRLSSIQPHQTLFPSTNTQPALPSNEAQSDSLISLDYRSGLSDSISLAGGWSQIPIDDDSLSYLYGGAYMSQYGFLLQYETAITDNEGHSNRFGLQGSIGNVNLFSSYTEYVNYIHLLDNKRQDPLLRSWELRLKGPINSSILPLGSYNINWQNQIRKSSDQTSIYAITLSSRIRSYYITNRLAYNQDIKADNNYSDSIDGHLMLSLKNSSWSLSGGVGYSDSTKNHISSYHARMNINRFPNIRPYFQLRRNISNIDITTYKAGFGWTTKKLLLNVDTEYQSSHELTLNFGISFGAAVNPIDNSLDIKPRINTTSGAFVSRIFLDQNLNGKFDQNESPIEGASLLLNGSKQRTKTDENGTIIIYNIAEDENGISVDSGSLEDPYWIPSTDGIALSGRPGNVIEYDFPIINSGEIDGLVWLETDEKMKEVAKVILELVDKHNNVIKSTKSAYDGFYLFDRVAPGSYTVRISPSQLALLNLSSTKEKKVTIGGNGTIVSRLDFTLTNNPI